jgi:hypothetical protein
MGRTNPIEVRFLSHPSNQSQLENSVLVGMTARIDLLLFLSSLESMLNTFLKNLSTRMKGMKRSSDNNFIHRSQSLFNPHLQYPAA